MKFGYLTPLILVASLAATEVPTAPPYNKRGDLWRAKEAVSVSAGESRPALEGNRMKGKTGAMDG